MKIAALLLGLAASVWAAIGSLFTYLLLAILLGLSSPDVISAAGNVAGTTALMWVLLLLFAAMGIASCFVILLPRLIGGLMIVAAIIAGLASLGSLLMLPAVLGFVAGAVLAFLGARRETADTVPASTPPGSSPPSPEASRT